MKFALPRRMVTTRSLDLVLLALLLTTPLNAAFAGAQASFRFPLSNFSGPVRSQWARLAVDAERNEIYALNRRGNDIRVFNEQGMETFVFSDGYSMAEDITVGNDGDIWILTTGYQSAAVHLLDYRGDHVSELELKNIPAKYSHFVADRLVYRNHRLYLVDSDAMLVIVVDERGYFEAVHDLNAPVKPELTRENRKRALEDTDWKKKQLETIELNGFCVDQAGNMFFTVPVLFTAFKLTPQGAVSTFGKPGSAPGKFGVAAGIATDDEGYVYVSDRLRSVVLIFDPALRFQTEFGYRGDRPSNLIVPDDLVIDGSGNVYVGQAANRGVSVFGVVHDASIASEGDDDGTPSRIRRQARTSRREGKAGTSRAAGKSRTRKQASPTRIDEPERPSRAARKSRIRKQASSSRLDERASAAREGAPKPTVSEKPEQIIDEKMTKPVEFVIDRGEGTPVTDPEAAAENTEEIGSDRQEQEESE